MELYFPRLDTLNKTGPNGLTYALVSHNDPQLVSQVTDLLNPPLPRYFG